MRGTSNLNRISLAELETMYSDTPAEASLRKVTDHINDDYARLIASSPFAVLATVGPEGLDCSPRGETPGFVRLRDPKSLLLPNRKGNNRIDSLRNIVRDERVALLFLIRGSGTTLRVNGTALITDDADLRADFEAAGAAPRSVLVITVVEAYFQCARAIVRSKLWSAPQALGIPSPGDILANLTQGSVGGALYDQEWPERAARSLW